MKKLLCLTALFFTVLYTAASVGGEVADRLVLDKPETPLVANRSSSSKAALKSVSTGVYYNRPVGTYYFPTTQVTYLIVPPLADMTFRNASSSKRATVWWKDGEPQQADYDYNFTTNYPIPDNPNRLFRFPYLKLGADTFALGDGNNSNYTNGAIVNLTTDDLAYFDMSISGGYYSMFTGGAYIFGSGKTTVGGKTYTRTAVLQRLDQPATPLILSKIEAPAITTNADSLAIKDGYHIEAQIFTLDDEGNLDERIATLNCYPADITYGASSPISGTSRKFRRATLTFLPEQTVMINKPFAVAIVGFDQAGVDVGLAMVNLGNRTNDNPDFDIVPYSETLVKENPTTVIYTDGVNDKGLRYRYQVVFWLNALLEPMSLISSNGYNLLTAPIDGGYALNKQNLSPKFLSPVIFPGNYELVDIPEWLTPQLVYDKRFEDKTTTIKLYADELPEGTGYRKAEIAIRKLSNGAVANDKIIVEQGDPSGVDNISSDSSQVVNVTYFDLLGRKITTPAKGSVVIRRSTFSDGSTRSSKHIVK